MTQHSGCTKIHNKKKVLRHTGFYSAVWVGAIFALVCSPAIKFPHLVNSLWVTAAAVGRETIRNVNLGLCWSASLDWNWSGHLIQSKSFKSVPPLCESTLKPQQQVGLLEKHQAWIQISYKISRWKSGCFRKGRNKSVLILLRSICCFCWAIKDDQFLFSLSNTRSKNIYVNKMAA